MLPIKTGAQFKPRFRPNYFSAFLNEHFTVMPWSKKFVKITVDSAHLILLNYAIKKIDLTDPLLEAKLKYMPKLTYALV